MIKVFILAILIALTLWGGTPAYLGADIETKLLILRVIFTAVPSLCASVIILIAISQL